MANETRTLQEWFELAFETIAELQRELAKLRLEHESLAATVEALRARPGVSNPL